jgi:hypothetical protein
LKELKMFVFLSVGHYKKMHLMVSSLFSNSF